MKAAAKPELRTSTLRRQANEAFCSPGGGFSIAKTLAIFAQIVLLYHLGKDFDDLVAKFDSLVAVLTFLVCPDVFKKFLNMKYGGNGNGEAKK